MSKAKWQPIETDPKGSKKGNDTLYGPWILGATDSGVRRLRWWDGNKNGETEWCNFLGDCENAYCPTHWTTLPEPPEND